MSKFQPLVIGCFIISAAHYVRGGADIWYALWILTAVVFNTADSHLSRATDGQGGGK